MGVGSRYAFRPKFDEFVIQYKMIGYQMSEKVKENSPETCKVILGKAGITGYQMGKHKVTSPPAAPSTQPLTAINPSAD